MPNSKDSYLNREISWLVFNDRVLQEAQDPNVPVLERLKFLGIFSSNLDEFFRVRVATLRRASKLGKKAKKILIDDPKETLEEIQNTVLKQTKIFEEVYQKILKELESHQIFIVNEKNLSPAHQKFIQNYFRQEVFSKMVPIMLDYLPNFVASIKDQSIYLAICLSKSNKKTKSRYALIEVPTDVLPRFIVFPQIDEKQCIILLEDIIRYCLPEIFSIFDFDQFSAYTVKVTRDAELDIENDALESYIEKISKGVKARKKGRPVRFIYDESLPKDFLNFFTKKLHLSNSDNVIPAGRYHNFKDFTRFPRVGTKEFRYPPLEALPHQDLQGEKSLLKVIRKKDILLHYPYQSFNYMTSFLLEAAIDPKVISIKMTLYRLAKNSNVVNALIHAIRNGTQVTVVVELQARFDEESNIYWANKLEEEGATVIYGVPGYKVHSKLCLLTRKENGTLVYYVNISTGNYNEETALFYCDKSFFTTDTRITEEVKEIFHFFEDNIYSVKYKSLIVSPFHMREKFSNLIRTEIQNAQKGKPAYIWIQINSLVDREMIGKLYKASQAGVKIKAIIRGACSLVPGIPGVSENIEAIGIIDRFLEHTRLFIFCNGGEDKYFISSADWMNRNLNYRIELACPIYDASIQQEIREIFEIQFKDNVKARVIDGKHNNAYRKTTDSEAPTRSQIEIYQYLKRTHKKVSRTKPILPTNKGESL